MANFTNAGAEIAASPDVAACQKDIRKQTSIIDSCRSNIRDFEGRIVWANNLIDENNSKRSAEMKLYAAMVEGLIKTGSIPAEVVVGSLAAQYPLEITKILTEIGTLERQNSIYQQNIADTEAKINAAQELITTIMAQYTVFVANIMAKWA